MKCKYLKIRKKNNKVYGCCLKFKIEKNIYCNECKEEISKQYKELYNKKIEKLKIKQHNPIKKVSKKQNRRQNKRFSIIYHDLKKCAYCGSYEGIELNEVFEGKNRQVSMLNGFIVPLCHFCHERFHNDRKFSLYYKELFQREFEKNNAREEFIKLIGRNYL